MKRSSIPSILFLFVCVFSFAQSNLYLKVPFDAAVLSTEQDSVKFSWNEISGASSYTVQLSNDPGFGSFTPYISNTGTRWIQQGALTGMTHWRVVSDNAVFSAVRTFSVIDLTALGTLVYHIHAEAGLNIVSNKVANWDNQANANYHASQAVSTARPTWKNNEINGLSTVHFGGASGLSQHSLGLPNFIISDTNFTTLLMYRQETLNTVLSYVLGIGTPVAGVYSGGTLSGGFNFGLTNGGTNTIRINGTTNLKWGLRSGKHNRLYQNGVQATSTTGAGVDRIQFNTIGLRPDVPSLNFHGDLAEVIVYNTSLNTATRNKVENYLLSKYTPYPDLGPDIDVCLEEFNVGFSHDPAYNSIQWSTGQTGVDSITVNTNGWYWVEVEAFDRIIRDSIFVEGLVAKPILDQVNDTTICLPDTLQISYLNTIGSGITVEWSDGSTAPSIEVFENDTIYATFTNTNGCSIGSDTIIVHINEFPATEGLGPDRSICLNTNLFFDYGSASGGPYDHLWGDGSTGPSFEPTVVGTQDYTIEVTDSMGCVAADTVQIELLNVEGPNPFFDVVNVCPYTPHNLVDASTPFTGDPIDSYSWFLPDDTLSGANSTYQSGDTLPYPIILEVTSQAGCSNRYADTARFFPQPEVYFVTSGNCQNTDIDFLANQLSTLPISAWQWDFDDPSSGINNQAFGFNPSHIFETFGSYDVELIGTDQNGCSDTISEIFDVDPSPDVDFSFTEICDGNPVFFSNSTTIDPINGNSLSSYNWSFGDGTFSGQTNPQKIYNAAGTFQVVLTAVSNNGCSATQQYNVKVHSFPQVDQTVNSDCAGIEFVFNDNSFVNGGSIGSVSWLVDNNINLNGFSVSNVINEPGSYNVLQTVSSSFGCSSMDTFSFDLADYIDANFDIYPNAFIAGTPTDLVNTSIGATDYEWTIQGIGTATSSDTTVVFPTSMIGDTVQVQLAVENSFGCRDSVIIKLPVLERSTDLEVSELFLQEVDGFYTVGVRLTNKGTTPINEVDLVFNSPTQSPIKEAWEGLLLAGESTIYVFESSPTATVPLEDTLQNFVCVRGTITQPTLFVESDLSNNEACALIEPSSTVLIAPQPNPIGNDYTVKVVVSQSQKASLDVYDALGKKVDVIFSNTQLEKGLNTFNVDATNYAGGSYTLHFIGEEQTIRVKMIKR